MSPVVDSNLFVTVAVRPAAGVLIQRQLRDWDLSGEELQAPRLFHYEVASALARLAADGKNPLRRSREAPSETRIRAAPARHKIEDLEHDALVVVIEARSDRLKLLDHFSARDAGVQLILDGGTEPVDAASEFQD